MGSSKQIGGDHYSKHEIQPLDIIDEYGLDYYRGNAIKYILRNKMDPIEDIEKAIHYLQMWVDRAKETIPIDRAEHYEKTGIFNMDLDVTPEERTRYYKKTGMFSSDKEIKEWLRQTR